MCSCEDDEIGQADQERDGAAPGVSQPGSCLCRSPAARSLLPAHPGYITSLACDLAAAGAAPRRAEVAYRVGFSQN